MDEQKEQPPLQRIQIQTADQEVTACGKVRAPKPTAMRRITVVSTVTHHVSPHQPTSVTVGYARRLESDEQCWQRRMQVGEDRVPLQCGWIEAASMLIVKNEAERFALNPTEEQQAESAARIVEIAMDRDESVFAVVHPDEDARFTPLDPERLYLRCRKGITTVSITLVPA